VPERIDGEGRGLVLRFVLDQKIVCRLLDRFPSLVAGFLLDDLAARFRQSFALAASLRYARSWTDGLHSGSGSTVAGAAFWTFSGIATTLTCLYQVFTM
jgi:hypothetical protein